jgi:hypothetical protein
VTEGGESVVYVCCFCGDAIPHADGPAWSLTLQRDPALGRQDLFAHRECLRGRMHPAVPLLVDLAPARGAHD